MNLNATFLGQVIIVFIIVGTLCGYYLGKRKTQTPKIAALLGFLMGFIPPLLLLYLAVLVIKNDNNNDSE